MLPAWYQHHPRQLNKKCTGRKGGIWQGSVHQKPVWFVHSHKDAALYPGLSHKDATLYPGLSHKDAALYPGLSHKDAALYPGLSHKDAVLSHIDATLSLWLVTTLKILETIKT